MLEVVKSYPSKDGTIVGYDAATWSHWKNTDKVPTRARYALMGFLAEQNAQIPAPPPSVVPPLFDHEELSWLFGMLIGITLPQHRVEHIRGKVAKAIAQIIIT
jgi:hypothetical protein